MINEISVNQKRVNILISYPDKYQTEMIGLNSSWNNVMQKKKIENLQNNLGKININMMIRMYL